MQSGGKSVLFLSDVRWFMRDAVLKGLVNLNKEISKSLQASGAPI